MTRAAKWTVGIGAVAGLAILASAAVADETSARWESLFVNGKDLHGWHEVGGGVWTVEDGEIVGKTGDGRYGWLVSDKEYADFVLDLECKLEAAGNSGIQFRSHVIDGTMYGWQADFDPKPTQPSGSVYDEGGKRQWIARPTADAAKAMRIDGWNRYRITAIGDHVKVELNGVTMVDFRDTQFTRGIVALQVHSGKEPPVGVRWRNIRIQPLDDTKDFTPLFDGKSLAGWHVAGAEQWGVKDREIIAECKKNAEYCYLVSDREYDNFDVRLKFICDSQTGNSGFFFRCSIDGVDIKGPQAEISSGPGQHTGLIYEAGGRGWVNLDQWDKLKDGVYRVGKWNELEVVADGPSIRTYLNGYPITDITDTKLPRRGILALQMHSGAAMKIRFKDLLYRPIKPATTKPTEKRESKKGT